MWTCARYLQSANRPCPKSKCREGKDTEGSLISCPNCPKCIYFANDNESHYDDFEECQCNFRKNNTPLKCEG